MYADTVTLFNRLHKKSGDVWYPTILHGVDLNVDKASVIAEYGAQSQDSAKLHVRYSVDEDGNARISGKRYLPPKEWAAQGEGDRADSLTFASGKSFDFFVVGAWSGTEPIDDAEHGGFYDHMNRTRDFCFAISTVARYSVIPHFEVLAK